jgi:hypothetical protein
MTQTWWFLLVTGLVIGGLGWDRYRWHTHRHALRRAQAAYFAWLIDLQYDPANPYLYERALAAGRRYTWLYRRSMVALIDDEPNVRMDLQVVTIDAAQAALDAAPGPVAASLRRLERICSEHGFADAECRQLRHMLLENL